MLKCLKFKFPNKIFNKIQLQKFSYNNINTNQNQNTKLHNFKNNYALTRNNDNKQNNSENIRLRNYGKGNRPRKSQFENNITPQSSNQSQSTSSENQDFLKELRSFKDNLDYTDKQTVQDFILKNISILKLNIKDVREVLDLIKDMNFESIDLAKLVISNNQAAIERSNLYWTMRVIYLANLIIQRNKTNKYIFEEEFEGLNSSFIKKLQKNSFDLINPKEFSEILNSYYSTQATVDSDIIVNLINKTTKIFKDTSLDQTITICKRLLILIDKLNKQGDYSILEQQKDSIQLIFLSLNNQFQNNPEHIKPENIIELAYIYDSLEIFTDMNWAILKQSIYDNKEYLLKNKFKLKILINYTVRDELDVEYLDYLYKNYKDNFDIEIYTKIFSALLSNPNIIKQQANNMFDDYISLKESNNFAFNLDKQIILLFQFIKVIGADIKFQADYLFNILIEKNQNFNEITKSLNSIMLYIDQSELTNVQEEIKNKIINAIISSNDEIFTENLENIEKLTKKLNIHDQSINQRLIKLKSKTSLI